MMGGMEIRPLVSFREVVRRGSFTLAARHLRMTQPAVSLHVKALEDEVGARLLERDGRGVRLTPAGKVLLETAEQVLSALDDAVRRIREAESPDRGRVVVACGDTIAIHLLPPVLRAFRKARPRAEVSVRNHGTKEILEMVLAREADIGLVTRPPWTDPALWVRTIREEPLLLAIPRGHPIAAADLPRSLSPLDGVAAVLLAKPSETRSLVERALRQRGVNLAVVMESGNLEVVKAYAAEGAGIAFLPEMAVTKEDRRRLEVRDLPDDFPRRKIAVVRRRDRPPGVLAAELLKFLGEWFRGTDADEDARRD
jgi:DNA-binding transcriptional LysR family regulator